ncbi:MAG TPA: hypothetical protein VGE74_32915 [Gemmata sp.]
MDNSFREDLRKYALEYFKVHADQRMKMFNFYILLILAMVAGLITLLKESPSIPVARSAVSLLVVFISFIFKKLDDRTRTLVKHSERALMLLEQDGRLPDTPEGEPHQAKLFTREAFDIRRARAGEQVDGELTYTQCFRAVFFTFGLVGVMAFVVFQFY